MKSAWQCPTLTGETPTTIGAEELNFRVRHGNGCDLFAIITRRFSDMYYYTMYFRKSKSFFEKILSKLDNSKHTFKLVKSSID